MTELLDFDTALILAESKRHVLLGNGFSIAYDPSAFSYGRLLDEADFSACSIDVRAIFSSFGTTDFEKIIEILRRAAEILPFYTVSSPVLAAQIARDADFLKGALAEVLAQRHPDTVADVPLTEFQHVRAFLACFDRIYTLNYDILLYWSTLQSMLPIVAYNDGFLSSEADPDAPWVAWNPTDRGRHQNVFYLHGALHLFDAGSELRKNTWVRTGVPIVTQTREALAHNFYPLVVTEGTSDEKYERILHSGYLLHGLRSFAQIRGSLFIYGHSLAANDEHILRLIEKNTTLKSVFISLFGDPASELNTGIIDRANRLPMRRTTANPLVVHFFDAESAHVWR